MNEIIKDIGKTVAVVGIGAAHLFGSTVEKACEIATDVGKGLGPAACEAGKTTAELIEQAVDVAATIARRK